MQKEVFKLYANMFLLVISVSPVLAVIFVVSSPFF